MTTHRLVWMVVVKDDAEEILEDLAKTMNYAGNSFIARHQDSFDGSLM